MATQGIDERRFWVVSPNVNNKNVTVGDWRQASVLHKAAFMGWDSNDHGHAEIGYDFAHRIQPNDVILIARRYQKKPEVIGFGVVTGNFAVTLPGFSPPGHLGSLRKLSPFIPLSSAPPSLRLMKVLGHTRALREIRPERSPEENSVCEWLMERLVKVGGTRPHMSPPSNQLNTKSSTLTHQNELEYEVRTRKMVSTARRLEAELVNAYRTWLMNQGRTLEVVTSQGQRCDAYEKARHNLLEAKCSSKREYVRMAVGQLLEYSFLIGKQKRPIKLAVLLPSKPDMAKLEWLIEHNISIVWREENAFLDNANGQFT